MLRTEHLPVVIVGGGFAGVTLAQHLEKHLNPVIDIVVISRDNHLVFTPMLAEVAGRSVSPMDVVVAGRQMTKRTRWIAASVSGIDMEKRRVDFKLSYGSTDSLFFGDLVLACGMAVNLDTIPGMAAHALPLKSVDDAFALGNALVERFEQAAIEPDRDAQAKLLTTVVLGGGFSGVEIAGHLHDLARKMRRFYNFAEDVEPQTIVVQRGERIIPELQHESLSEFALKKLRANGVEVLLKTAVKEISKTEVHLDGGERLAYGLLIGTVGNTANAFVRNSSLPLDHNRIKTDAAMQVEGQREIWALGDCAVIPNAFDSKPSPPTAQFALRQAKQLARNISRSRKQQQLAPFYFQPQGLLASIGQRNGVAEIYGMKFSGFIAWILWRAVYLMKMPSLSRKISIAMDWLLDAMFGENLVRVGDSKNPTLRKEHYVSGDVIYRQGQPSKTLYFIEKGVANVRVEGQEGFVARLQQGEHFGLSAIEQHETDHTTTVVADVPLDLVAVDRPDLYEMSREGLTRELVHLLELRQIRQSWQKVIDKFPDIDSLRVGDVMLKEPPVLREEEHLQAACEKLSSGVFLAVTDSDDKLIGICTREGVSAALAQGMAPETAARKFMSDALIVLAPDHPLRNATYDYLRSGLDLVPVVNEAGVVVGAFGLIEAALNAQRIHEGRFGQ